MLPSERLSITVRRHQASRAIVCHMLATTSPSVVPEGPQYMFALEKWGWSRGEREGTILGNGSKKGILPVRLPCSQLEGGCRAGQQQSTVSHLRQPFPLHLGHIPCLSLRSIHFISKQKDHSSILNTFLQKKQCKAP